MHKLYYFGSIIAVIILSLFLVTPSRSSSQNIVISQIQLGDKVSAKNEFIELYNNSSNDIEITNWCLYYQSASLKTEKLTCFIANDEQTHLFLPGYSTIFAVSSDLIASSNPLLGDIEFSATLSGTAGYVLINDMNGVEVDRVGWGTIVGETNLATASLAGEVISRRLVNETSFLQDTDIYFDDFEVALPKITYSYGSIYELNDVCNNIEYIQEIMPEGYYIDDIGNCLPIPVDICLNLDGLQEIIPEGYGIDDNNDCRIDICANFEGLQIMLPDNMTIDEVGYCVESDYCPNILDIQTILPPGYELSESGECDLIILPLQISEVLPSVTGVDEGGEFIEIFNPNDIDIDLVNYLFSVGFDESEKFFEFPANSIIAANQYFVLFNSAITFTLKNTTDMVRLYSIDKELVDEIVIYEKPEVDESWSIIDGLWQYTNQLSPGAKNIAYLQYVEDIVDVVELTPCGPNQYRSPETNRCRNIINSESTLIPCKDGQYRSEETNRCRNIVSDVAEYIPCAEGQERNPETNRCRNIESASVLGANELLPCPEGQERNPATNRCRNVVSDVPKAEYETEPVSQLANNSILWWSLGGVAIIAICYGVWEWRREIGKIFKKVALFLHIVK